MYTFEIKETGPNLDATLIRALLVLAALASLVITSNNNFWINILCSILLLVAALFIHLLLEKLAVKKFVLLAAASTILLLATNSLIFGLILFLFGILTGFLNPSYRIHFSSEGIQLHKCIWNNEFRWNEFSNVILKDELITLDFKNNRLMHLTVNQDLTAVNEVEFNLFCSSSMKSDDSSIPQSNSQ